MLKLVSTLGIFIFGLCVIILRIMSYSIERNIYTATQ